MWTQVAREPIVREAETQVGDSGLRLDLGECGVWQPQAEALFDFNVSDTVIDHPTAIARQNQFLNRELRPKRGFTSKQWKVEEVLLLSL